MYERYRRRWIDPGPDLIRIFILPVSVGFQNDWNKYNKIFSR